MKTSSELKWMARRALQGNYGNAAGALLVIGVISALLFIPFILVLLFVEWIAGNGNGVFELMLVSGLVMFLLYMLFYLGLMVGYIRLCYQIVVGAAADLNDLFFGFKNNFLQYLGLLMRMVLCGILADAAGILVMSLLKKAVGIFLGFLLGSILILMFLIFIQCRYVMALFVLVENPQIQGREAMRTGKELMQGNLWRMIKLELSFFGMFLLGFLSLGIGYLWIMPYIICTNVLFYRTLKDETYPPRYQTEPEEEPDIQNHS